jgi:hypothetical protein
MGWPIGYLRVLHPKGVFPVFSYYSLIVLFLDLVCLTMALTKFAV